MFDLMRQFFHFSWCIAPSSSHKWKNRISAKSSQVWPLLQVKNLGQSSVIVLSKWPCEDISWMLHRIEVEPASEPASKEGGMENWLDFGAGGSYNF
ncbi:hypothetical protein C2S52_015741 [Perilla frutescens var. hirtella]|nr:hypothetical protein C2S52_015741 [Perilla frutescens var. hirtella]KAH6815458.1 hypothetical protein C2S51_020278 [Perilla frutescens var. frutescens]